MRSKHTECKAADERHASAIGVLENSLAESQAQLQLSLAELEVIK